jgi:hypothetical protein
MTRGTSSLPPADAPYYRYDPHLGNPRDKYRRVDFVRTRSHQPEQPGRFAAVVEGETFMASMWGRRSVKWRAEPGTPCLILGYWSDGTVHIKWPAIANHYMVDGRFPAWVVEEDPTALVAGGGFILLANELLPVAKGMSARLILLIGLLAVVILLLLLPPTREAFESLLQLGR